MLYVLGDVHAQFRVFDGLKETLSADPDACVIQLGDFGVWPGWEKQYDWASLPWPVYFVDGNHEHFQLIPNTPGVHSFFPNLHYVARGTVLELQGKRIGFCGGGESIDRRWRKSMVSWFAEERVRREDFQPLLQESLDLLITHSPPQVVRDMLFPPLNHSDWGLPYDWKDVSMLALQELWDHHQSTPWYCGHMHASLRWQQVHIVGINELLPVR